MPAAPDTPATHTIGDAARLLGVTVGTIRRWEATGKISAVRTPGGQRRIPNTEIIRILTTTTTTS